MSRFDRPSAAARVATACVAATLAACAGATAGPTTPTAGTADESLAASASPTAAIHAIAELRDVAGQAIGTARFTEDAAGRVHLAVHVRGVTPGLHGLHLHTVGACTAGPGAPTPAFLSAGGHYDPTKREHGHDNPNGFHAGDLPNLEANAAGMGQLSVALEQFTLAALADLDGTAIVLHQNEDDRRTHTGPMGPGNSGARVACGVVQAS